MRVVKKPFWKTLLRYPAVTFLLETLNLLWSDLELKLVHFFVGVCQNHRRRQSRRQHHRQRRCQCRRQHLSRGLLLVRMKILFHVWSFKSSGVIHCL